MNVTGAAEKIGATVVVGTAEASTREIRGGDASDFLSDVMGDSREGDIWVTMEKYVNIVAVPQLNGLAGIVLVNGRQPEPETAKKAEQEHAPIISTPLQCFDMVEILYGPGIGGRRPL